LARRFMAAVEALARKAASDSGVELVDLEYGPAPGGPVLRLFIDKEGGITVGDCTRVSRAIGDALEIDDPIPGSYRLEVSSPGVNRPLKNESDFARFEGSPAQVVLRTPVQGHRTIGGIIQGCEGGTLTLKTASAELQVEIGNIARARLDVDPWERAKAKAKTKAKGKRGHAG
jgi:ribosome maturation factor RimP